MGFENYIAGKHLTNRRRTGFISLVTLISVAGVGVGVMALIVVLAVMSGFDRELKSKIVSVQPHIRIEKYQGLEDPASDLERLRKLHLSGVRFISPFVEGQAILKSSLSATGIILKGVDLKTEDLSVYSKNLKSGNLDLTDVFAQRTKRKKIFFHETVTTKTGGILLGEGLAARLGVRSGDAVEIIAPFQDSQGGISLSKAETRSFVVRGIFRLGMNDFDTGLAIVSLEQAQSMFHLGSKVSAISLRFEHVDDAESLKHLLRREFYQDYFIRSWYDMNHNFFQALKVEKSVMTILLALIVLVAAFNIVSSLTMVVMEKTKDIGVLRALGATKGSIRSIFVTEGFCIGMLGVVVGAASGLALATHLNEFSDFLKKTTGLEVFPSDIYYFDRIPAQVNYEDVIMTLIFAVAAAVLAGFYPAHRAAQLNPIEALRYE